MGQRAERFCDKRLEIESNDSKKRKQTHIPGWNNKQWWMLCGEEKLNKN